MNEYWDYNTFYSSLPAPSLEAAQSQIFIETLEEKPENLNKIEFKEILYNYVKKNYVNVGEYDEWNYFYKKSLKNNLLLYIKNISYKKNILNLKLSLNDNIFTDIIENIKKYL